jgi:DNA-binding MarR family transcriptional regulator
VSRLSNDVRRMVALTAFAGEDKVTQRSLARELGISLGLTHALLHQLKADRYIAMSTGDHARALSYAITAAGRRELKRVAGAVARESGILLAGPRAELEAIARELKAGGARKVLLCGDGPLADVAASALRNGGLKLAGVVARDAEDTRVVGKKVQPIAEAAGIKCDAVVAVRAEDAALLRRRLKGVSIIAFLPKEQRRG